MSLVQRIACMAAALTGASSCSIGQIFIQNPGFEQPALTPNAFTLNNSPGWFDSTKQNGVFYPTVATWGYKAPYGNQVGYTNNGYLEQTLAATYQAGVEYVLQVDVVRRPAFFNQNYYIELRAGDIVLAKDNGSLTPPLGGSLVSTLKYFVLGGDPAVGKPITIRVGGPSQCNFDNVRLNDPGTGCYQDCDGTGSLDIDDFICFQTLFALGDPYADCDGDGNLTIDDFICFQTFFAIGC